MKLKLDWTVISPIVALAVLGLAFVMSNVVVLVLAAIALAFAVFAAVHHAEVIAHRVGEPFGTLVLAVAVTVIEVALIVSVMLTGGPEKAALPRDTVFAAIMIVSNGHRRTVPAGRRDAAPRTGFPVAGRECIADDSLARFPADARAAGFHGHGERPVLSMSQLVFVGVNLARALRGVRVRADRAPSRLFFPVRAGAGPGRRRRRSACAATDSRSRLGGGWVAAAVAGVGGGVGEACCRRRWSGGCAGGRRGGGGGCGRLQRSCCCPKDLLRCARRG